MDNPMRPTCTAHTRMQTAAQTRKHKHIRPLPGRPTVRQSDTQIYPHSPHDRPARWLSSCLINSHQWPRAFGCHLNQNCKTQTQQTAHFYTLSLCVVVKTHTRTHRPTHTCIHTHKGDNLCALLCVFHIIAKYTFFFTAKLTGCQNTVINCFLGSPINCHICQSQSNYSYFTVILWTVRHTVCTGYSISQRLHMIYFRLRLSGLLMQAKYLKDRWLFIYFVITHNSVSQHICINKNTYWFNIFCLVIIRLW